MNDRQAAAGILPEIVLTPLGDLDINGTLFSLSLTILGRGMGALAVPAEPGQGGAVA